MSERNAREVDAGKSVWLGDFFGYAKVADVPEWYASFCERLAQIAAWEPKDVDGGPLPSAALINAARQYVIDLWTALPALPQPSVFTNEDAPGICLEWLTGNVSAGVDLFDDGPPRAAKVVIGKRPLHTQVYAGPPNDYADTARLAAWLFSEEVNP